MDGWVRLRPNEIKLADEYGYGYECYGTFTALESAERGVLGFIWGYLFVFFVFIFSSTRLLGWTLDRWMVFAF